MKYAWEALAISSYPGATAPVNGWWVPKVMLVELTPGVLPLLEVDEPQPTTAIAAAMAAIAASHLYLR